MKKINCCLVVILFLTKVSLCGEENQTWRSWAEALRKKAYAVKTAVKETGESWWSGKKKQTGVTPPQVEVASELFKDVMPQSLKTGAKTVVAGMESIQQAKNTAQYGLLLSLGIDQKIIDFLVQYVPTLEPLSKGGMIISPLILPGFFIVGAGIHQIFAYYHAKDLTKEAAINAVQDLILMQLVNQFIYPTRTTKINALLKKNEFLLNRKDVDDIVSLACNQIIENISKTPYTTDDQPIDLAINKLNAELLQFSTIEAKINYVKGLNFYENATIENIGQLLLTLQNIRVKAALSVLLRLEKQQMFEALYPNQSQETLRAEIADVYQQASTKNSPVRKLSMTPEEREQYLAKLRQQKTEKQSIDNK